MGDWFEFPVGNWFEFFGRSRARKVVGWSSWIMLDLVFLSGCLGTKRLWVQIPLPPPLLLSSKIFWPHIYYFPGPASTKKLKPITNWKLKPITHSQTRLESSRCRARNFLRIKEGVVGVGFEPTTFWCQDNQKGLVRCIGRQSDQRQLI